MTYINTTTNFFPKCHSPGATTTNADTITATSILHSRMTGDDTTIVLTTTDGQASVTTATIPSLQHQHMQMGLLTPFPPIVLWPSLPSCGEVQLRMCSSICSIKLMMRLSTGDLITSTYHKVKLGKVLLLSLQDYTNSLLPVLL